MPNIKDVVTQKNIKNSAVFRNISAEVNIDQLKNSPEYAKAIHSTVELMLKITSQKYDDFGRLESISAPNINVPLQIIVVRNKVYINPTYTRVSKTTENTYEKCCSLDVGVKVRRYTDIDISYYNANGEKEEEKNITQAEGGYAIQHEMDHLKGILITDSQFDVQKDIIGNIDKVQRVLEVSKKGVMLGVEIADILKE